VVGTLNRIFITYVYSLDIPEIMNSKISIYTKRCSQPNPLILVDGFKVFIKAIAKLYDYQRKLRPGGYNPNIYRCLHEIDDSLYASVLNFDGEIFIYLRFYNKDNPARLQPTQRSIYMRKDGFLRLCLYLIPLLFTP